MVHCTAGVGRTGVIILTDLMLAYIQSNQVSCHSGLGLIYTFVIVGRSCFSSS